MTKVRAKYNRPGNVANFRVPRTNKAVASDMNKGPQIVDTGMQEAQMNILKGMIPVLKVVDDIGAGLKKDTETYLEALSDSIRLLTAAFNQLSQSRKDVIRNDLQYPIAKLCNWDIPVGPTDLLGVDIGKKLKELGLDSSWKKKPSKYSSGKRFKPYSHSNKYGDGKKTSKESFGNKRRFLGKGSDKFKRKKKF